MLRKLWKNIRLVLGRYFVAGVVAFAPIGVTIWAIAWIVRRLDNLLLPTVLHWIFPAAQEPPSVPLLGAVFTLIVILLFGVVARHLFGWELVRLWERLLSRVPVARNIYSAVKQLFEAIFRSSDAAASFSRVAIIEYPREGLFALAFVTGPVRGLDVSRLPANMVNVFVPTTPNPTSGFYLLVPEVDLISVDLTVEQAFKLVMSAGLVSPDHQAGNGVPEIAPVAPGKIAPTLPSPGKAS
ncbi:MAG: DUF502 domain-containing protein [Deltaproteobacteria bacterium]|nr:DUF502 domain-containing protein [Deltaproteobacteria bacterium]MBW2394217.1 DUF502 domain-containing protein [Deltaproteobacteria bacterium]